MLLLVLILILLILVDSISSTMNFNFRKSITIQINISIGIICNASVNVYSINVYISMVMNTFIRRNIHLIHCMNSLRASHRKKCVHP